MSDKTYSLSEIRKKHHNAYAKWSAEDETVLANFLIQDMKCPEIAKKMGRQKSAIRSRIRKMKLKNESKTKVSEIADKSVESEQNSVYEILLSGKNVLITGQAGTGKTFLLNRFISYLKENKIPAGVTASTGIASTHINGQTIHSWVGFGIKEELTEQDMHKIINNDYVNDRVKGAKVLIIDEISMLHDFQLDMTDKICKSIRENEKPFGGLQIVLCGDFYQLPPVSKGKHRGSFITNSKIWDEMDLQVCYLTKQFRHTDTQLSKILNEIRANDISEKSIELLLARVDATLPSGVEPTKIYTHNSNADAYNLDKLDKIDEEEHKFQMKWGGDSKLVDSLKKSCLAPEELILKKGAVVMFVRNNKTVGYVNGTTGKVIDFDKDGYPIVEVFRTKKKIPAVSEKWQVDENLKILAWISQVPLRLAWAITTHKSQGMTLDYAEIDLSKSFTYSLGYVALSRVRALEGMCLKGFNSVALKVSKEAIDIDSYLLHRVLGNIAVKQIGTTDVINKAVDPPMEKINEELIEIQADKNLNETDFQEIVDLKNHNKELYEDYSKSKIQFEEKSQKAAEEIASLARKSSNLRVELNQLSRKTYKKSSVHAWLITCGIIILILLLFVLM